MFHMPIFLLMAAGAMLSGGAGLMTVARRRMALQEARELRAAEIDALRDAATILELRRRVAEAGGDPDAAVAALRAFQSGQLTIAEVERYLEGTGL